MRDSSSLSCDLEVFHKGDREEFVKQAKKKIRQFGVFVPPKVCVYITSSKVYNFSTIWNEMPFGWKIFMDN